MVSNKKNTETKKEKVVEKKITKIKKVKDPNAPKKPQTAYFLFLNAHREEIRKTCPNEKYTQVMKRAGEMWKALEDKSEWNEMAQKAKTEYEKAKKDYESGKKGPKDAVLKEKKTNVEGSADDVFAFDE